MKITPIPDLIGAVRSDAPPSDLLACELPTRFRAAYIRKDEIGLFDGAAGTAANDVRRSIHVGEVDMPDLAPDEVVVAVMAAAVNYNTVWSAIFEPVPTFRFLEKFGGRNHWNARHDLPYHVLGSDAAGVIVRTGSGVRRWQVGDHVVIHCVVGDEEDPDAHDDSMMARYLRIWGFETNFGAFGEFTVVKSTQLITKPAHLTWEEAAASTLCGGTAYRMLVGTHGARMKQGDIVLIWGATGGLGSYAVQFVRNGGGIPVAVVSSQDKEDLLRRQGCELVINRHELGLSGAGMRDPKAGRMLGEQVRRLAGGDPDIVFEYLGAETFGASVYVTRRGGAVVTCGSSTGFRHEFDNRFLWMNLKRIIGSHAFNYREAVETNRLIVRGAICPTLSKVYPLADTAIATRAIQLNQHVGKIGVLCAAPSEGLGVTDPEARERIGEDKLALYRNYAVPAERA